MTFHGNAIGSQLVRATAVRAMSGAGAISSDNREIARAEQREVFPDRCSKGPVNLDSHPVQSRKCAGADAADNDGIDLLIIERPHRIASTVRVLPVTVRNRDNGARFRVNDHEDRGGAEMVVDGTFDADVILDRKSDPHADLLLSKRC